MFRTGIKSRTPSLRALRKAKPMPADFSLSGLHMRNFENALLLASWHPETVDELHRQWEDAAIPRRRDGGTFVQKYRYPVNPFSNPTLTITDKRGLEMLKEAAARPKMGMRRIKRWLREESENYARGREERLLQLMSGKR